jgi:hypothetical protein
VREIPAPKRPSSVVGRGSAGAGGGGGVAVGLVLRAAVRGAGAAGWGAGAVAGAGPSPWPRAVWRGMAYSLPGGELGSMWTPLDAARAGPGTASAASAQAA